MPQQLLGVDTGTALHEGNLAVAAAEQPCMQPSAIPRN
jgi:hypothetical protein